MDLPYKSWMDLFPSRKFEQYMVLERRFWMALDYSKLLPLDLVPSRAILETL
jgi:hypothetical protein